MLEECHPGRRKRAAIRAGDSKEMANSRDQWQHFGSEMPLWSLLRAGRYLLSAPFILCAGCGATGLDWVGAAHLEAASQQQVSSAHSSSFAAAPFASIPATAEQANEARPRLNHTVTLGEIDASVVELSGGPAAPSAPTVIVNNYNQVNVGTPAFGYGNYRYSRASGGFSPGHVTPYRSESSSSSPLPGQSWPAVADHGPSFPYQAAPASPWTRTQ